MLPENLFFPLRDRLCHEPFLFRVPLAHANDQTRMQMEAEGLSQIHLPVHDTIDYLLCR